MGTPDSQLDINEKDRVGQIPTTQATQGFHALHLIEDLPGLSCRPAQSIVYMSKAQKQGCLPRIVLLYVFWRPKDFIIHLLLYIFEMHQNTKIDLNALEAKGLEFFLKFCV